MTNSPHFIPAYGPIQDIIGYIFFFATLRAISPTIVSVLDDVGVDPSLTRYALAIGLWLLLGLTLISVFQTQWRSIQRRSPSAPGSGDSSQSHDPSRVAFAAYLLAILVSGTFVAVFFSRFLDALSIVIRGVANVPDLAIPVIAIVWIVLVGLAMGTFGWCLDRTVIGAIRVHLGKSAM